MIFFVSGNARTGKTILIAIFGLLLGDSGVKILSNFTLDTKTAEKITPFKFIELMEGERVTPGQTLILHEIWAWLNSHKTFSPENDVESAFVYQAAKLNFDIFCDSQIVSKVDSSLKKLANYRYEATAERLCNRADCLGLACVHCLECCFTYYELDVKQPNDDVRTGNSFDIPFALAAQFWNRYRTYDRELPLGFAEMKGRMEILEPKIMLKTIARQTEKLIQKRYEYGLITPADVTLIAIKDALYQEGEIVAHAAYVQNRIKNRIRSGNI